MAKAAQAAGITVNGTTAELEDAMRKGLVQADKVLPHFADMLNATTQGANFDNLQTSLNRFRNTWTEFVGKANFAGAFKSLVDGGTKALSSLTNNLQTAFATIIGVVTGLVGPALWKKGATNFAKYKANMSAQVTALDTELRKLHMSLSQLDSSKIPQNRMHPDLPLERINRGNKQPIFKHTLIGFNNLGGNKELREQLESLVKYNKALLELDKITKSLGKEKFNIAPRLSPMEIEDIKDWTKAYESLLKNNIPADVGDAMVKNTNNWQIGLSKVFGVLKGIGSFIASNLIGAGIALIVGLVSKWLLHIREVRKENQRIANISKDAQSSIGRATGQIDEQLARARVLRDTALDTSKTEEQRSLALAEINKLLHREGDDALTLKSSYDEVTGAVNNWYDALVKVAKQQAAIAKIQELAAKNISLELENTDIQSNPKFNQQAPGDFWGGVGTGLGREANKLHRQLEKNNREIEANNQAINDILKMRDKTLADDEYGPEPALLDKGALAQLYGGRDTKPKPELDKGASSNEKTLESVLGDFSKDLQELDNKRINGLYDSTEDYQHAVEDLKRKTLEQAAVFGDLSQLISTLSPEMQTILQDIIDSTNSARERAQREKEAQELAEASEKINNILDKIKLSEPRDNRFDYQYSDSNKGGVSERERKVLEDNLESRQRDIQELENAIADFQELINNGTYTSELADKLGELVDNLHKAKVEADSLHHALIFAEAETRIRELQDELNKNLYSSFTNLSQVMERLYNSVVDIGEAFGEDWKWEGLEKFLSIINAIVQALETFKTIAEAVNTIQTLSAQIAEKQAIAQTAAQQVASAAEAEGASITAAAEAAKVTALKTTAAAAKEAAIALGTANAMAVPFPGNLAALASNMSAILTALAAGKGIQGFKDGGFVQGGSGVDNTLIRATPGELVLNKSQQKNLFDLLNQGGNLGGKVEFEIRGDKLRGVLNNYDKKIKG